MTRWTSEELAEIDAVDELEIRSLRQDGTMSGPRTIWAVREGNELYVRSVNGPDAAWYRATRGRHEGRIRAGAVERDVMFIDADHAVNDRVDAAYRTKYRRYAANIVDSIVTPQARSTTTTLVSR